MPERLFKPQTPATTSSPLQPKASPIAEVEALGSRPALPLKDQLECADRLGLKFREIPILSPERSEPDFSSMIQRSAAIGVLGGGALAGASTTATGTVTGAAATGGFAAGSGVSGGLVLVGTFAVGGTLVLGVYALGAMTHVPTGDPETWPQPNPQPGPPPQAPAQRLKVAPLPPGQDPSKLPTYTPEQLGMTQAEAMRLVAQESIPGQSPTGIREDLIPMTGDLPNQVEGIPMEQPGAQVLGEDPVQVPGAHDPLTTPMEGPQLPQVESFPDAELNQPGEAAPALSKEQGALEKAMQVANWEQVKDHLGKRLEEVGVPPGYFPRPKDNPEELVRSVQDDSVQVPLQLLNGVIDLRVSSSNRISNPTEMKKNFEDAYGKKAKGYELHHLNPDNLVQELELLQFSHEQGWYNLDRASNLLGMPGKDKWEKIQSGEEQPVTGPGYTNTMGHWSNHDRYDREVVAVEIEVRTQLILEHFEVKNLSDVPQERMSELKEMVMNSITEAENRFRQLIDNGQVKTKDGRISWGSMNEREAA